MKRIKAKGIEVVILSRLDEERFFNSEVTHNLMDLSPLLCHYRQPHGR